MSRNEILDELYRSSFINELINKITSGHKLKHDLKSELFLILCEMPESRIILAYNGHYLNYLCINILKKQFHSNTSPFHKKYRGEKFEELGDWNLEDLTEGLNDDEVEIILNKVRWIVDNKLDLVDRELFKLYYKWDRYDRWTGDLRDKDCVKPISSYRKIEKKLTITTLENGKNISIGRSTIALSHKRSIDKIIKWLGKI